MKNRPLDANPDTPKAAGRIRVGKQVVGKHRVEIKDRIPVEADLLRRADKKLDRILVIEDHLRFEAPFSFRFLAKINQASGIEQRIGVAFKTA